MSLTYLENTYTFRSKGVIEFLRLLIQQHPKPLTISCLMEHLPQVSPRQMARYVEAIEAHEQLRDIIQYRTKTRGPFHLNVPVSALKFVVSNIHKSKHPSISRTPIVELRNEELLPYLSPKWVIWVEGIARAVLSLNSAHFSDGTNAHCYLDAAEIASKSLPEWTIFVVHTLRAHFFERESKYAKATPYLKLVEQAANEGKINHTILARARLSKSKAMYDQGRYEEAEKTLYSIPAFDRYTPPAWLNLKALVLGQKFNLFQDVSADSKVSLVETLSTLTHAMGEVFMLTGDQSVLDALSFNYANNLLRGLRKGLFPIEVAQTILDWLLLNKLICKELGTGDHSIYTHILIFDVMDEFGLHMSHIPKQLSSQLNNSQAKEDYLNTYLRIAQQYGNRLEICECLFRLGGLANTLEGAKEYLQRAFEIAEELGHKKFKLKIQEQIKTRSMRNFRRASV